MDALLIIFFIHLLVSWMLIGVAFFEQLVHYPLYQFIKKGFPEYESTDLKRSGGLIGPLMCIEMITAIFLIGFSPSALFSKLAATNLILLILIWFSFFLFQIDEQHKLVMKFTRKIHLKLLRTNWVNSIIWLFRGILVLIMLFYLYT